MTKIILCGPHKTFFASRTKSKVPLATFFVMKFWFCFFIVAATFPFKRTNLLDNQAKIVFRKTLKPLFRTYQYDFKLLLELLFAKICASRNAFCCVSYDTVIYIQRFLAP